MLARLALRSLQRHRVESMMIRVDVHNQHVSNVRHNRCVSLETAKNGTSEMQWDTNSF